MPYGNVGTPTSVFMELIRQCKLPGRVIGKLDLEFPKSRSKRRYGAVGLDYGGEVVREESEEERVEEEVRRERQRRKIKSGLQDKTDEDDELMPSVSMTDYCDVCVCFVMMLCLFHRMMIMMLKNGRGMRRSTTMSINRYIYILSTVGNYTLRAFSSCMVSLCRVALRNVCLRRRWRWCGRRVEVDSSSTQMPATGTT